MTAEILYDVLLGVTIVAIVFAVIALWKVGNILDDLRSASKIANKRVKQLDVCLDALEQNIDKASSVIKGFVTSLETGQKIKQKIKSFWD